MNEAASARSEAKIPLCARARFSEGKDYIWQASQESVEASNDAGSRARNFNILISYGGVVSMSCLSSGYRDFVRNLFSMRKFHAHNCL